MALVSHMPYAMIPKFEVKLAGFSHALVPCFQNEDETGRGTEYNNLTSSTKMLYVLDSGVSLPQFSSMIANSLTPIFSNCFLATYILVNLSNCNK